MAEQEARPTSPYRPGYNPAPVVLAGDADRAVGFVSELTIVPVKALRVVRVEMVQVTLAGIAEDRAFFLVEQDGRLVSTRANPGLLRVAPSYDRAGGVLRLAFPDGMAVDAPVVLTNEHLEVGLIGDRSARGVIVDGPFAGALSRYLGRAVRLAARTGPDGAWDDAPLTLMTEASVTALAADLGPSVQLEPARFRMTVGVGGMSQVWAEEHWDHVRVGGAVLKVIGPTERCIVTQRHPLSGDSDHDVLKGLARSRGRDHVCFGIWLAVLAPGTIVIGDPVTPLS